MTGFGTVLGRVSRPKTSQFDPRGLPAWWRGVARSEVNIGTRVVVWALAIVAALAAWLVVFGVGLSSLQYQHAQHNLYNQFREELAGATAPLGGSISEGAPVALLDGPAGGLNDTVVVEGTTGKDLRSGPGHYPGVPLPGQAGTSVLMGRSSSFGGPFGDITSFHKGDLIKATTGQGSFTYVVEDVRYPGDPVPATLTGSQGRLVLVTSAGSGWRSGFAPSQAVFVDALLKGKGGPVAGGIAIATTADGVLSHDTSDMYPLILWLQLLAIAVVATIWLGARWGRWQSWLVSGPVVLAALWGASSAFWPLLPNLL